MFIEWSYDGRVRKNNFINEFNAKFQALSRDSLNRSKMPALCILCIFGKGYLFHNIRKINDGRCPLLANFILLWYNTLSLSMHETQYWLSFRPPLKKTCIDSRMLLHNIMWHCLTIFMHKCCPVKCTFLVFYFLDMEDASWLYLRPLLCL